MIGIYKITSPSGKIYIGQSVHIQNRFTAYRRLANCSEQPKLLRSFLKYGVGNHIFEVIEECQLEDLNTRERHWQEFYHTVQNGLNCMLTRDGDRSGKHSKETIEKIRIARKHQTCSEETKERIRQVRLGTKQSEETKQKRKNTLKIVCSSEQWLSKVTRKPVIQIKDSKIIAEYPSILTAKQVTGITTVGDCLAGRVKVAGGFIWKYKNQ
jgi:group I intron endonuclease